MNKISKYLVFFVLVAVVLIAAACTLNSKTKDKSKIGYLPNLEYSKNVALSQSTFNFSEIKYSSEIVKSELPQELQVFVLNDSINQSFKKIEYSDSKNGYLIEYILNTSDYKQEGNLSALYWLNKKYIDLAKVLHSGTTHTSRTNLFALLELENSNYRIRIEQSLDQNTKENIKIEMIVLAK